MANLAYYPMPKNVSNNLLLTAPSHSCAEDEIDIRNGMTAESKSLLVKWDKGVEYINVGDISTEAFVISSRFLLSFNHFSSFSSNSYKYLLDSTLEK